MDFNCFLWDNECKWNRKRIVKRKGRGAELKIYHHVIIIAALVLFVFLFYQEGFGSIAFLFAAIYLSVMFIKEVRRYKKSKKT